MTIDVLDRLPPTSLLKALFRDFPSPHQLLSQAEHLNPKHQTHYFNWGRNALFWLIKAAKWPKVAVPDFTCPVVVEAITQAGAQPIFLPTSPHTLLLDLDGLKKTRPAPALIAVHTHGLVENITAIRKILPDTHIVEDCATALFSRFGNHLVGRRGDSVLFSLYKQVNGLNGALLTTNLKFSRYQQPEPSLFQYRRLILNTAGPWQWYLNHLRRRQKHQLRRFPFTANKSASDLARRLFSFNLTRAEASAQKIQSLLPVYHERAQSLTVINPISIDIKTQPHLYRYPILLKQNRDEILLKLRSQGVFVDALWDDSYGDSPISRSILTLPIKSTYTPEIINQLFNQLQQVML